MLAQQSNVQLAQSSVQEERVISNLHEANQQHAEEADTRNILIVNENNENHENI